MVAALTIVTGCVFAGGTPAQALIALPSFVIGSGPVVIGQPFTIQAGYRLNYYDPNSPVGCPNPIDWVIDDPSGDPVASGHIDAWIPDPNGGPTQTFSSQAVIDATHLPGTYTIQATDGSLPCDYGQFGSLPVSQFDVVEPDGTPIPPQLTLAPADQTRRIDNTATVTANLTDISGVPEPGITLDFSVTGPNATTTGTCQPVTCATDRTGTVTFTYAGTTIGHDTVNTHLDGQTGPGTSAQTAVDWTHSVNGYRYAALGDSYSSGEGTYVYDPDTDLTSLNMCHRSTLAYGPRLAAAHPATLGDLDHVACSGAITDDLWKPNHNGNQTLDGGTEPGQLCTADAAVASCGDTRIPALGPHTTTVTLTIGGNDAGFRGVLQSCIWTKYGNIRIPKPGHPDCSLRSDVTTLLIQRIAALGGVSNGAAIEGKPVHSYASVLAAIHKAAPNAHVYIAGYPLLFQDNNLQTCVVGTAVINNDLGFDLAITALDAEYLDTMSILMNRAASTAVRQAGSWATYVDVTGRFTGHGLCSRTPWINPINGTATGIPPALTMGPVPPEDAHPTAVGQSNGYQAAFTAVGVGH